MVTCKDVALKANVSTATVSRALRQGGVNVAPETYQRVLHIAQEMHYTPNQAARSLRTKSTRTIGLIIPNIENPFYIRLASVLENTLRDNDCRLSISFLSKDGDKDEQTIIKMMIDHQVSGIIFSPRSNASKSLIEVCAQNSIKIMQILTMAYEDLDAIVMDDNYGMFIGTQYLFHKGHRKILFAGNRERMEGVNRAYDEAGIPRSNALIYTYGQRDTMEYTIDRLETLLAQEKPTAVFAVTDFIGIAIHRAMKRMQMHFPDDISFLMYDDQTWSAMLDVSVITHPMEMIADIASHRLIQNLDQKAPISPILSTIKPFLLERSSVQQIK